MICLTEGRVPRLTLRVLLVDRNHNRPIEEDLLRFSIGNTMLLPILADVSGIPLEASAFREILGEVSHANDVYTQRIRCASRPTSTCARLTDLRFSGEQPPTNAACGPFGRTRPQRRE